MSHDHALPIDSESPSDADATATHDAQIVAAAAGGDRVAFGRLYEVFAPLVHGVVLARVDRADVDDLVQDVFVLAMRRLSSLRDASAFGPWIAAIARNRTRDHHRRRVPTSALPDDLPHAVPHQAEMLGVLAAIRALPEAYRETLVLRLVEGMSGPEIAARTGLTHGSVRVNLHRGMLLLRAALTSPGGTAMRAPRGVMDAS